MKIELKRFTTNARLSQETTAFAADVWVDGKKAGHAANDGHGGATIIHLDPAVRAKVEAHGKALVPDEYKSFMDGAEWIVDQLAFAKRLAKRDIQEKTFCAQQGLRSARFRDGDNWRWFAFKSEEDPKIVAGAIADKHKVAVDELVVL